MTDIHLMAVLDSLKNIFHKGGGGDWGARGRCTVGSVGGGGSLTARGFKLGASIVAEPKVVDL